MDVKHWRQNAVRLIRMRAAAFTDSTSYLLAMSVDLNGYCIRLYNYDSLTDSWSVNTDIDPNTSGRTLWGDATAQWTSWAYLYDNYRTDRANVKLVPPTFAGTGSQTGTYSIRDPTGYFTALLNGSFNLPAATFRSFISDAQNVKVVQGLKATSANINWGNLLVSQVPQAILSTVDNTTLTLTRELYPIREFVGGVENNASTPAHVLLMPFELNELPETDRFIDIGTVKFDCDMTFM